VKHLRVLLALSALSLGFGLSAGPFAPTSVSAEAEAGGPASRSTRFLGFVFAEPDESVPTKVRAMGAGGVVCGTASVRVVGPDLGFYDLEVTGHADRPGCPRPGALVSLWLLYGKVDDGVPAATSAAARFLRGQVTTISLGTSGALGSEGWSGAPPSRGGVAILRWNGPDAVPVADAVALLDVRVTSISHYDPESASMLSWFPDAPSFVQTYTHVDAGDIVVVRAR